MADTIKTTTDSQIITDSPAGAPLSQRELIWRRFRRHKLANISLVILILLYVITILAPFVAPSDPHRRFTNSVYAPPQRIRFRSDDGFSLRPFVCDYKMTLDPETWQRMYKEDPSKKRYLQFFVRGDTYNFLGTHKSDLHLFGAADGKPIFLLGTDEMGRDLFSRVMYGSRISLTIGLVGVFLSLALGLLLGGISGLVGGKVDTIIQRIIEILMSVPSIPLWMALSAALPPHWSQLKVYFGITVILSIVGWTGVARVVRGKFLALREEEFVLAARSFGATNWEIVIRHLIPSFMSYVIVNVTLSVPGMIMGETSLSFLGLGMQAPAISWGTLLQDAQNIRSVALYPWLLAPGLFVIIVVLAFNFLGDGLRDAVDPYS